MDRDAQEAHIDVLLAQWKEQMLRMPETIPVVMLYATMQPASGSWGIFVNARFQNIYMMLLEAMVRGDLPIETDLFSPDERCCFKMMRYTGGGLIGIPYLCSHVKEDHSNDDQGCMVPDCECEAWTPAPILTAADFEGDNEVCSECGGRGTIHENSAVACPICTPLGGGHGSHS